MSSLPSDVRDFTKRETTQLSAVLSPSEDVEDDAFITIYSSSPVGGLFFGRLGGGDR